MNPNLQSLRPYAFERLNALKDGVLTQSNLPHVSLALGEPKHDPPEFVIEAFQDEGLLRRGLTAYPATRGEDELRKAIAQWHHTRYALHIDEETQVLPVNGTREGLFSFGQAVLSGRAGRYAILPNPFYQIYEGTTLLSGTTPYFLKTTEYPEVHSVPDEIWANTDLVVICSPSNPTGRVLSTQMISELIEKAQEYDFVLASDECYSEIYPNERQPPPGLLKVAYELGLDDFNRCISFNSLSKRSNCPGLRSGFVAGDQKILAQYYNYRTYHGCAMPVHVQMVSAKIWQDEEHVIANRLVYRQKFEQTQALMGRTFGAQTPEGAFYYWPDVGMDDVLFTQELYRRENITVLPGSYLARHFDGLNPGVNRVRIALVASLQECIDAIRRLCAAVKEIAA